MRSNYVNVQQKLTESTTTTTTTTTNNNNNNNISRKEGGRGLASIEDTVDASIQRIEDYIEKRGGRLIAATRNNTDNTRTNTTTITRKQKWEEKELSGHFKLLINNISHQKTWPWQRKGNLKRETESLQIVAQNNAIIWTNHIEARIKKTQQNCRCRSYVDRNETINYIISECNKLAQKEYKTIHDLVSKVTHGELCKKLKFDHMNKWYMHNPESVLENETHKLFWDFRKKQII